MLLMLKLLATTVLLSSLLQAGTSSEVVKGFIEKTFKDNPNIKSIKVNIANKVLLKKPKGWEGFIVDLDAVLAKDNRQVKQKTIWFSNGEVITQELLDVKTAKSLKELVTPKFKDEYYSESNLIYGNKNAKNKVVIFSDPLCPFCKKFVPKAINEMKPYPNKFAIYYYHFPLPSLHPAAVTLVKAAIALELKGPRQHVVLDLYKIKINSRETDVKKILKIFNKSMNTNIKPDDLKSPAVLKHFNDDMKRADSVMVQGTPTMFFNGEVDKKKNKYKDAK